MTTAGCAGSTATVRTRPRSLTDRIALAPASATYVVPRDDVVAYGWESAIPVYRGGTGDAGTWATHAGSVSRRP
ncbi:Uncharacterised protein [Mycobacteroides abscessus]|nr:Uncharacterised protein [Mycobacteroides abscessus]